MRSFGFLIGFSTAANAASHCKSTPLDPSWPSLAEWASLNATIGGNLIHTVPAASSCYGGNPFDSTASCDAVEEKWTNGTWHSMQPESIDYPIYANASCLPKGAPGYSPDRGCTIGGLPQYIVNATREEHVAVAMQWADKKNIRIVVKGTGHDLNGRSSGAFSLSIWTRNFNKLERDTAWSVGNSSAIEDVFIVGSGQQWGNVLNEAMSQGRVVTTGQDPSVGLGGYIQGGGHGPLSRTYGLASNQVLQMRVVTVSGDILVADATQNQDLFWALRGGGAGQYGVVTEYVIRHFPAPENVIFGVLKIAPKDGTNASMQSSWGAVATLLSHLPDLMDAGLAGAASAATGETAFKFLPELKNLTRGAFEGLGMQQVLWALNSTEANMEALVAPVISAIQSNITGGAVSVELTTSVFEDYSTFFAVISGDNAAGSESVASSRLLGRRELTEVPHEDLLSHLKVAIQAQNKTSGTFATIGLQGGPGIRNADDARWGALHPSWRSAYLHFLVTGATVDSVAAGSPKAALKSAADWTEKNKEALWRTWAPETGAYMNEANPFNTQFPKDYYGDNYEGLLKIKDQVDPNYSLYVLAGVGSENWEYDLDSGKLCRFDNATSY